MDVLMFSRNGRIFLFKARKTVVWMQIFSSLRLESLPEGHVVEVHWHCNLQRVWFEVRPKSGEGFSLLWVGNWLFEFGKTDSPCSFLTGVSDQRQ